MTDPTRFDALRNRLAGAFRDLVFPTECQICEGSDGPFCDDCRDELLDQGLLFCERCACAAGPFENLREGCAACRGRRLGFDAATALGPYQGPIRRLCLMLKHERNAWLARRLADLLINAPATSCGSKKPIASPPCRSIGDDAFRGYDQSSELAKRIARRLDQAVGIVQALLSGQPIDLPDLKLPSISELYDDIKKLVVDGVTKLVKTRFVN